MPIYEYQCKTCAHQLEVLQKMTDAPLIECPSCHQPTLAKLVSAAGFQLKGSGWYATDYKPKSKGEQTSEAKTSSTETKPKETQSTELKPASEKKESSDTSKTGSSS